MNLPLRKFFEVFSCIFLTFLICAKTDGVCLSGRCGTIFPPPQEEHLHTSMLYGSFIISVALRFSMQKYIFTSKRISTVRHLFALVFGTTANHECRILTKRFGGTCIKIDGYRFPRPELFSLSTLTFVYSLLQHM